MGKVPHQKPWVIIRVVILGLLLGLIFPSTCPAASSQEQVNILILNSYHQGMKWTDDHVEGIIEKLSTPEQDRQFYVEYLDWKRYPYEEHLADLRNYFRSKYGNNKALDLIITTDDMALEFALKYREEMFSNAPIVFSGVLKSSADRILQGQTRVTGVYEYMDAESNIKLALQINPGLKNIYIVHDLSESGQACGDSCFQAVERVNRQQNRQLNVHSLANLSLQEVLQTVSTLEKDSIVLIGTYFIDGAGEILVTEVAASQISQSSTVPVYSLYDFHLDSGITGGYLTSGRILGELAGEQAQKILNGEDVENIPIIQQTVFIPSFNYDQLVRFNISEDLLPETSQILHKPFSFVETYRSIVYTTLFIFVVLVILIFGLSVNIKKRIKVEKQLRARNEEITAMHEELTATEEELRQQFDELMHHKQQLEETKQLQELVLEAATDSIWDWDIVKDIRRYYSKNSKILGYDYEEIKSVMFWENLIHPEDKEVFEKTLMEHLDQKTLRYNCDYRVLDKEGNYRWIRAFGKALFNKEGQPYRMVGSHRDITELKEKEMEIEYLAYHDSLTGLPNRVMIKEIVENEIAKAKENGNVLALMFFDMDNFKAVNDTYGHATGDQLLVTVSRHLKEILDDNVVARLAGDEFLILIRDVRNKEDVIGYVHRIQAIFEKVLIIYKQYCYVSASIGIAYYPKDGENFETLLINADTAMHKAKEQGKRDYVEFNAEMGKAAIEKAEIHKDLRKAIENQDFLLYYQPQVEPITGKILGLEALIRWQKDGVLVPPNKFIGVAEETGLILPIGRWVMKEACGFLNRLNAMGYQDITMAVNISALQLKEDGFVEMVLELLDYNRLDPSKLELEITETVLIEFLDTKVMKVLNSLMEHGVKISLDDFGLGYSSLNYIKQLPISTLKVDKSFIDDIHVIPDGKNITGMIITLAHQLGLKVIAEGVEKPEQRDYLLKYECDAIQGYLFSKPLPEEQILKLLKESF